MSLGLSSTFGSTLGRACTLLLSQASHRLQQISERRKDRYLGLWVTGFCRATTKSTITTPSDFPCSKNSLTLMVPLLVLTCLMRTYFNLKLRSSETLKKRPSMTATWTSCYPIKLVNSTTPTSASPNCLKSPAVTRALTGSTYCFSHSSFCCCWSLSALCFPCETSCFKTHTASQVTRRDTKASRSKVFATVARRSPGR